MASLIYIIIINFQISANYLQAALIAFVVSGILMMALALAYVLKMVKEQ